MPEKWTGDVVGLMHINRITVTELASELCVSLQWASSVLNGHRTSKDAEQKFRKALENIISRRQNAMQ